MVDIHALPAEAMEELPIWTRMQDKENMSSDVSRPGRVFRCAIDNGLHLARELKSGTDVTFTGTQWANSTMPWKKTMRLAAVPQVPSAEFSVTLMQKDMGQDMLDWVAWHRLVGMDHFFFYDNGSKDPLTHTILSGLAATTDTTVVRWPFHIGGRDNNKCQEVQMSHALWAFGSSTLWLGDFDLDEFFVPHAYHTNHTALAWKNELNAYQHVQRVALPTRNRQKGSTCGSNRLQDCCFARVGSKARSPPKGFTFTGEGNVTLKMLCNPHYGKMVLNVATFAHFSKEDGCYNKTSRNCIRTGDLVGHGRRIKDDLRSLRRTLLGQ